MDYYYKYVKNDVIEFVGSMSRKTELYSDISYEKYEELDKKLNNIPKRTLDFKYQLSNKTEEYIRVETNHDEKVQWYVNAVLNDTITLDEVPEDFIDEVNALISEEPNNPYGIDNNLYLQIKTDEKQHTINEIVEEASKE